MAKPSLDDLISQVRKEPGPSSAQLAADRKKKAAKAALAKVPVNKKRPTPGKASQDFVDKAKSGMKAGQKADAATAKKKSLAARMERKKNLQRKKNELQRKKKEGEERKSAVNSALAKATSGPRASSGSSMGGEGASADKAALQSAGQAVGGAARAVGAAAGLDKKMDKLRKKVANRLNPKRRKGLATGAASTGRNNMKPKSSKPSDPWKSNKPKDPWKEEFSHWREEFIFEVDDKVPTKKEKTVQPMSGKNTIIINPDSMQEAHKKDHTYLETDMKKRKKNNEKAIADMKKVKDDTIPRWMREGSDWRSELGLEEGLTDLQRRRYLGRRPGEEKERLKRSNERKDKKAALAAMQKQYKGMKAGIYSSYEPEGELVDEGVLDAALKTDKKMGELHKKVDNDVKRMKAGKKFKEEVEHLDEMPYQVYGSPDGKKEKKIGKPVKSGKYASARAAELEDTHRATGGRYRAQKEEVELDEATYPSDFRNPDGSKRSVAKRKYGRPQQHDQETDRYGRRKTVDENAEPLKSEEDRIPARQGGNQWGVGKSLLCPVCGVVGCTNPEHQVEEGAMPATIDPAKHRAAQKATKIRNLMRGASTAGEKEAARRKTRGPALAGEHYDWRGELGEGAAWTKKSGKSDSGGLNEKGRKSYERENPGSDLKAPSKKVGNPRRSSFCARMKGMKKKLTSKKTASDPDSRINKSLRAWNC